LRTSAVFASRPESGSSRKSTLGLWMSAAEMSTLCFIPFEYELITRSCASAISKRRRNVAIFSFA
jgi:hypothetical protein